MTKEQILDIVVSNLKSLADTFPEDQRFEVNESTVMVQVLIHFLWCHLLLIWKCCFLMSMESIFP